MKTIEDLLQETYGHKKLFKENGDLTDQGQRDYNKFVHMLYDLKLMGLDINTEQCVRTLGNMLRNYKQ